MREQKLEKKVVMENIGKESFVSSTRAWMELSQTKIANNLV